MTRAATREDRLADIACQLVERVRDNDPADNWRWLANILPNPADQYALVFVLAAAVPDDKPWLHLTAWTQAKPAQQAA